MISAIADLARLRAPGLGVFASGGPLFSDAVFGRDSITAAEDLLHLHPEVSREVILTLGSLQGTKLTPAGPRCNEEEPGKIHHEHRSLFINGRRIGQSSEHLLKVLGEKWGGDGVTMTYYGTADATPRYARLLSAYSAVHGTDILDETVVRNDGQRVSIEQTLVDAMSWVSGNIDASNLGLVTFLRRNPGGLFNQVWKDSPTSYVHRDGKVANPTLPIAAIEVQGYAYDALMSAADLLNMNSLRVDAEGLRQRVLKNFWSGDESYPAMGIVDGKHPRLVESVSSNGALLLDTRMFDELSGAEQYVSDIARRICGPDFLTEVGIRCRSLREDDLIPFQDYHGSWAVWSKETFEVAHGLRRQGLIGSGQQLGNRILNAVNVADGHAELLYVSKDGRVMYDFLESDLRPGPVEKIFATSRPETPQAWSVTAALAVKRWPQQEVATPVGWRQRLDAEITAQMPDIKAWRTQDELRAARARRGNFVLDSERARELSKLTTARSSSFGD